MSENELEEILKEVRSKSQIVPTNEAEKAAETLPEPEAAPELEIVPEPELEKEPERVFIEPDIKISEIEEIILSSDDEQDNSVEDESEQAEESEIKLVEEPSPKSTEDYVDMFSLTDDRDTNPTEDKQKKSKKGIIIALVALIVAAIIGAGVYFALSKNNEAKPEEKPTETKPQITVTENPITNPLTGEADFNSAAVGQRPVAVVVENEYSTESVRPQWALDEADIVLEGESEFSTRMLLFWADYTAVPDMVGPARSARPPFIRFSQLFDCIFVHAGMSKTKGNYIGANTVFVNEDVDHINLLALSEDGYYFGRNNERYTAVEHTGYLNGKNLPELIEKKGFNTKLNNAKFSELKFNEEAAPVGDITATSCKYVWSGNCPKTAHFTYDEATHKYLTTDFDSSYGESNVKFENLIFLFDQTEYIVKENYKHGMSETYCDYKLSGGSGTILSEGTAVEITWGVDNGKIWMKTSSGDEVKLNVGKSYIGYGSSNHGGNLVIGDTAE